MCGEAFSPLCNLLQNYRRELLAAVAECMDCGDAEVFAQEDQGSFPCPPSIRFHTSSYVFFSICLNILHPSHSYVRSFIYLSIIQLSIYMHIYIFKLLINDHHRHKDQYSSNTDAHTGTDMDVSRVRVETRMVLMEMLLWSMTQASSHNMAYLLCGFDVFKPIHKTQIQDPGLLLLLEPLKN